MSKPGSQPSAAVANAIVSSKSAPAADKLDALRAKAEEARSLELMIAANEEETKGYRDRLNLLYQKTLPDLMDEAKVDRIGLPQSGNHPPVDYVMSPYYSASIASSWDAVKKEIAFDVLKKYGAEDLIKTEVSAKLPKGSLKTAKALVAAAKKLKVTMLLEKSVHSGTLKSWLKEISEKGKAMPKSDLEKIGGSVGRIVKPKDRD